MDQRHAFKFDTDRYARAQAVFASKREIFAEDAITSLARDVINCLAEEKSGAADPAQRTGRRSIMPQMVDAFCDVILGHDPAAPLRFLEDVLAPRVANRNDLYEYIACASRELGAKWEADKVTYLQVTVAAGKLYALVRSVGCDGAERVHAGGRSKNALFASVPGEQHTLGVTIATEVFRNAGWDIALMIDQSHEVLIDRAAAIQPPVVGLSISNSNGLDRLARLVVSMRLILPDTVIAVAAGPDIDKDMLRNVVDLDFVLTDAENAVVELTESLRAFETG
ncbi:MAG: cobalamin B12-binding domain-containing protein [Rhodobacteraceae bacterium]|nr:cobalamin B12-binding domain-containing protein [Paracoccaceae bacterium]